MPPNRPVNATEDDIEINDNGVRVDNPDLVRALIKSPEEAIGLLREVAPVDLDDIDVDRRGRLVIKNSRFAARLKDRLGQATAAGGNGVCGAGCSRPDIPGGRDIIR